jgi:transposase
MKNVRFIGLDVHAETIAVAVAEPDGEVRSLGTIPNRSESVVRLMRKLGKPEQLRACYEAGPTGYVLYWQLTQLGMKCEVVAPTLIPVKAGDRVKTDRRDAEKLARCYRGGDLTAVWVPDAAHEALRDLVWLKSQRFEQVAQQATLEDYQHEVEHAAERIVRLERSIDAAIETLPVKMRAVVEALQSLRGVAQISAVSIVAELGVVSRFARARQLMGYSGAVPWEDSSGQRVHRGSISKAGNAHLRRIVVEAAWSYRHRPAIGHSLKVRQRHLSTRVCEMAWQAQHRLHQRYARLTARGKSKQHAVTAVARELLGFIWAIGTEVERNQEIKELRRAA